MANTLFMLLITLPLLLLTIGGPIYLFVLLCKALRKYISSKEVREEKDKTKKVLGEVLKENRMRCNMTQEYVAEYLGVSRQAVSKWERGESDPNMSNLIAMAKLYGVAVEEILKQVS